MDDGHESPLKKKRKKTSRDQSSEYASPQKKKQKSREESGYVPSAKPKESKETASHSTTTTEGRNYTVSVALPGSILANAQTLLLQSCLAGQIARALAVFSVDEIIVFDETVGVKHTPENDPNVLMGLILQYLEIPQYLRKAFVPHHQNLRYAGLLSPLDSPHHMRMEEEVDYREGVVLARPPKVTASSAGSYVNCGLKKEVRVDKVLDPNTRVTVRLNDKGKSASTVAQGVVVPPSEPRTARGLYWGYSVRFAERLGAIFSDCPYKGGYDLTIGTSERGQPVDECEKIPEFKHVLIVFGGVKGLEFSLETDESLHVEDVSELFQLYLNTCPMQGSRTIRTEEAILISMAALRPKLVASGHRSS